jgi:hypothetical protein
MNTKTYTYLLANPQKISQEHQDELSDLIEEYPYFQSARALQLKGLKNSNNYLYNDSLKLTAAYTANRNILFEYITSDHFIQNEISELIQQHDESVIEIEVVSENISKQVSIEIDNQIKGELKKAEAILNPDLFHRKKGYINELVEANKTEANPSIKEIVEVELEENQPLDFTKEDGHSFSEWLKLTSATPIIRKEIKETSSINKQNFDLIDKFIQDKPKLKQGVNSTKTAANNEVQKNLASQYSRTSEALMTETLAKVYLQQKNFKKALQAYHILSLKYPEKSGFFADQIRAINKQTNTKDS